VRTSAAACCTGSHANGSECFLLRHDRAALFGQDARSDLLPPRCPFLIQLGSPICCGTVAHTATLPRRHRRSYDASEEGRSVEAETALEEMEEAEEEEREVEEVRPP